MSYENDYVPMSMWGKDHWSTMAYVESVMVDCAGFQVGSDGRMRSNRRHLRVMNQECPRPKRMERVPLGNAIILDQGTLLKDGSMIRAHDDWCCIQDMAEEGLFTVTVDRIEPGVTLVFSEKGKKIAAELRLHKAGGGSFLNFEPNEKEPSDEKN